MSERIHSRAQYNFFLIGLGGLGVIAAGMFLATRKLGPMARVTDSGNRVVILGGLIEIDRRNAAVRIGNSVLRGEGEYKIFNGKQDIDSLNISKIVIPFVNGKIEITPATNRELSWNCNLNQKDEGSSRFAHGKFIVDLAKTRGAQCGFHVPVGIPVSVMGHNGELILRKPAFDVEARLGNGQIEVDPDTSKFYHYETNVVNGQMDDFSSSSAPNAIKISLALNQGRIRKR